MLMGECPLLNYEEVTTASEDHLCVKKKRPELYPIATSSPYEVYFRIDKNSKTYGF